MSFFSYDGSISRSTGKVKAEFLAGFPKGIKITFVEVEEWRNATGRAFERKAAGVISRPSFQDLMSWRKT